MTSRLILLLALICTFMACSENNTKDVEKETTTPKEATETQEDEPGEPSCDFRPRIVEYQNWLPTDPVNGVYLPRYIKIPSEDITSLGEQTEDDIYAFFAIKEKKGNNYVDIVFGVKKAENAFWYYDFTNPCPDSCEDGIEVPNCAEPPMEKNSKEEKEEDEPGEPSCDFRVRIVEYADWLPEEPVNGVTLPQYVKIPAADIISLAQQTEDDIYAFMGLLGEGNNTYVDIIFGVKKAEDAFWYYDFTNPCPDSCELGRETPECDPT